MPKDTTRASSNHAKENVPPIPNLTPPSRPAEYAASVGSNRRGNSKAPESVKDVDRSDKTAVSGLSTNIGTLSTYTTNTRHSMEDPILRYELEGGTLHGVPFESFITLYFPDWYTSIMRSAKRFCAKQSMQPLMKDYVDAVVEDDLYDPFKKMGNYILQGKEFSIVDTHTHTLLGSTAERRPDFVLIHCNCDTPCRGRTTHTFPAVENITWADVLVPIELKKDKTTFSKAPKVRGGAKCAPDPQASPSEGGSKLNPRDQLASYAMEVLSASNLRHFTLAILITNSRMELWHVDRAGRIGSSEKLFGSEKYPFRRLFALITALGEASSHTLGYSKSLGVCSDEYPRTVAGREWFGKEIYEPGPGVGPKAFGITLQETNLAMHPTPRLDSGGRVVPHPNSRPPRVLFGRATAAFLCTSGEIVPRQGGLVVKCSYQPRNRRSEVEFLKDAYGLEGIPILRAWIDMEDLVGGTVRGSLQQELAKGFVGTMPMNRIFRAIVLEPFCVPLYTVTDTKVFMKAFRSLVKAHRELYVKRQILHRDINVNNLMVRADDHSRGVLIDLDFACRVRRNQVEEELEEGEINESEHLTVNDRPVIGDQAGDFTMSTPFLAVDLLTTPTPKHIYRHDLESFFWAVVWIAVLYEGGSERARVNVLRPWHTGDLQQMQASKKNELLYFPALSHLSSTLNTPAVRSFLQKFADLISAGHNAIQKAKKHDNARDYEAIYADGGGHIIFGAVDNILVGFK